MAFDASDLLLIERYCGSGACSRALRLWTQAADGNFDGECNALRLLRRTSRLPRGA